MLFYLFSLLVVAVDEVCRVSRVDPIMTMRTVMAQHPGHVAAFLHECFVHVVRSSCLVAAIL
jgi:hypothetical protein